MTSARISVIIPARNSEVTIAATLDSVLAQTLAPCEVIVVGSADDPTASAVAPYLEGGTVRYVEAAAPAGYVRDAQYKRRVGARDACGAYLFFTDSKVLLEPHALERALHGALTHGVHAVAGTARSYPADKRQLMAILQDEALIQNNPRFAQERILTAQNFGASEDLPVTTALMISREAFAAIEHDFGVAHSRYGTSYEDYAVAWLLVSAGYSILCTPEVISYHKHRLTWRGYARQIARSGQGAALFAEHYPDCPFAVRRASQVELWVGVHAGALLALLLASVFAGFQVLGAVLVFSFITFLLLGVVNAVRGRTLQHILLPPLTYALVWVFVAHYLRWRVLSPEAYRRHVLHYVQLD